MDLQRQRLLRVEDFDEQREPAVLARGRAEQFRAMVLHEPAQVLARERAVGDDAHVAGAVADLPRFADRRCRAAVCLP